MNHYMIIVESRGQVFTEITRLKNDSELTDEFLDDLLSPIYDGYMITHIWNLGKVAPRRVWLKTE